MLQGENFLPAAGQPDPEGAVVQPGPGGQGPGGGKVIDPARPPPQGPHRGVVGIEHLKSPAPGTGRDWPWRRHRRQIGVPVQVVRGDVQQGRGLGMEMGGGVQLEAAHLQDQEIRLLLPGQQRDHGGADIAPHQGLQARGREQLPHQGGGGGLAVGAAHRHQGPADKVAGHFQLPQDRDARVPGRLEPGKFRRHPGGKDDGIIALPAGLGHAQFFLDPQTLDLPAGIRQVRRRRPGR